MAFPNSPPLYEDGDVIVRTSNFASGIFVVHKDVLVKNSTYMAALLSPKWSATTRRSREGKTIYQLDLFFDQETNLSLLTGNPQDLNRTTPSVDPQSYDLPYDASPEYGDQVAQTLAEGSQAQYCWDEPQPLWRPVYSIIDREVCIYGRRGTYGGLLDAHTSLIPTLQYREQQSGHPPRCHEADVSYARLVWKALIDLLYGHDIELPKKASWQNRILFIANTYVHADYLGFSSAALSGLSRALMREPDLWIHVSEEPETFLHLSYRLGLANLCIDAVKHLCGQPWGRTGSPYSYYPNWTYLDAELFALVNAARIAQTDIACRLITGLKGEIEVMDVGGGWRFRDRHHNARQEWFDSVRRDTEIDYLSYILPLKRLLVDRLFTFDYLADLDQEHSTSQDTTAAKLRSLYDLYRHPDEERLNATFGLTSICEAQGLNYDRLLRIARSMLSDLRPLQAPCDLANVQNPDTFAWMSFDCLNFGPNGPPWPFNDDGTIRDESEEQLQLKETRQATYRHIEDIGLGTEFAWMQGKSDLIIGKDYEVDEGKDTIEDMAKLFEQDWGNNKEPEQPLPAWRST